MPKKQINIIKQQTEILFLKQHIEYEVNEVRKHIKHLASIKANKNDVKMLVKNCFTTNDRLGSVLDLLNDIEILVKRSI